MLPCADSNQGVDSIAVAENLILHSGEHNGIEITGKIARNHRGTEDICIVLARLSD